MQYSRILTISSALFVLLLAGCSSMPMLGTGESTDEAFRVDGKVAIDPLTRRPLKNKERRSNQSSLAAQQSAAMQVIAVQPGAYTLGGCPELGQDVLLKLSATRIANYIDGIVGCRREMAMVMAFRSGAGLPITPIGEVALEHSRQLASIESGLTKRSAARWSFGAKAVTGLTIVKSVDSISDAFTMAAQSAPISVGSIHQSTSQRPAVAGGAGGSGFGGVDTPVGAGGAATGNASGTGDNSLVIGNHNVTGIASDAARQGVTSRGPNLINDTSGTQNVNDGRQNGSPTADELNGGLTNSDNDGTL